MKKNQYGLNGSISFVKSRNKFRVFAPVNKNILGSDGKPIRKSLGCYNTFEEAQKQLEIYNNTPINHTFSSIMDLWLNYRLEIENKPNTITSIHFAYNSIKKLFGSLINEDINNIHNKDIIKVLNNSCYSYTSLSLIKTYLNDIFNFSLSNGWSSNNFISLIKLPKKKKENKQCDTYSEKDVKILFDSLSSEDTPKKMIRYIKIMLVLLYTGLRKEELFTSLFDTYNSVIYTEKGKTSNSIRQIPIHHKILDFVKEWDVEDHKPKILKGITSKNLNYNFSVINKHFGFKNYNVHNCRKSFITRLICKGASLPLIAKLVGHSTKSITIDIYTKPNIEEFRQVINLLN